MSTKAKLYTSGAAIGLLSFLGLCPGDFNVPARAIGLVCFIVGWALPEPKKS